MLQNILILHSQTGEIVVEYGYSAYGETTITYDTSTCNHKIGRLNSFRYKGYYYDEED